MVGLIDMKYLIILLGTIFIASSCNYSPRRLEIIDIDKYLETKAYEQIDIGPTKDFFKIPDGGYVAGATTTVDLETGAIYPSYTTDKNGKVLFSSYCIFNWYGKNLLESPECLKHGNIKVSQKIRDEKIAELKKENDMRKQANLINGYSY